MVPASKDGSVVEAKPNSIPSPQRTKPQKTTQCGLISSPAIYWVNYLPQAETVLSFYCLVSVAPMSMSPFHSPQSRSAYISHQ